MGDAAGYELFERIRWPDGVPRCPHCGSVRCRFLPPRGSATRATRTRATSARRVWRCSDCRRQFSALTGSVLHGSRISPTTWSAICGCYAVNEVPPAGQLQREFGLSRDGARHVVRLLNAVPRGADDALGALLRTDGVSARRIRESAAVRRSPRRQVGPSADYGRRGAQ